jgi:hypothetical protein
MNLDYFRALEQIFTLEFIMKWLKCLLLAVTLTVSASSYAATPTSEPDGYDVLIDAVFLRPLGLVGTVAGAAAFVGLSPLVALANIPAPHDAFDRLANTLVIKPAKYTFKRPVGDYDYNEGASE